MIDTEQRNLAAGLAPPPVSTVIVRRKFYPRVPPEVLLRDHAVKFHLSGLSLCSLLSAITPVTSLMVPWFISRVDAGCGASSTFIDTLLRDAPRRPPVPLDNIKQLNPGAARLERELHRKEEEHSHQQQKPSSHQGQSFNPRDCAETFKFDEVMPSRLSAVALIHGHAPMEEREALWGYDTGAVMHVRLQTFASDLVFLSRRDMLAMRKDSREPGAKAAHAAAKAQAAAKKAKVSGDRGSVIGDGDIFHLGPRDGINEKQRDRLNSVVYNENGKAMRKSHKPTRDENTHGKKYDNDNADKNVETDEDNEDDEDSNSDSDANSDTYGKTCGPNDTEFSRKTPRGVSLLGFHPVGGVTCVAFDSHTSLAISGGADGMLLMWDTYNRYRPVVHERHARDDDLRHTQATQQFAMYVRTRRLVQRHRRAHDGAVSAIATHCELLLTGGADGIVHVWSCGTGSAAPIAGGPPPQYIEQQSFRCGAWVRHIWCAAERSAQGDGVLVTDDTGAVTALRGCTLAQPPPAAINASTQQGNAREMSSLPWQDQPQWQQYLARMPTLLDTIRRPSTLLSSMQPVREMRRDCITQQAQVRRMCSQMKVKVNNAPPYHHHPHNNNDGAVSGGSSSNIGKDNNNNDWALALLMRGAVTRVLVVSRVLRINSEESRLAGCANIARGAGANVPLLSMPQESTNTITRLIPLFERNLLIALGYSPVVRLIDMTRLVSVSVVEHPDLSAAGKGQSAQSNGSPNRLSTQTHGSNSPCHIKHRSDARKGATETLRFMDVLYISSFHYLILLDNRDTVFVWDSATGKVLATWRPPHKHRSQRATGLLTCGTRHYGMADHSNTHPRNAAAMHPFEYAADKMGTQVVDCALGITRVPFFIVRAGGLELCEVVVAAHARVEVRGHEDIVIGLSILCGKAERESNKRVQEICGLLKMMKEQTKQKKQQQQQQHVTFSRACANSMNSTNAQSKSTTSFRGRNPTDCEAEDENEEMGDDTRNEAVKWLQDKLCKSDGGTVRVLSCSADGTMRFWTSDLKPLDAYNPRQRSDEINRCDIVAYTSPAMPAESLAPLLSSSSSTGGRSRRGMKRKNSNPSDVTSFHYSAVWNLAVTGHDDGSIRLWPCNQLIATCTWHKDLHRNAISGLSEGRIQLISGCLGKRTLIEVSEMSNRTVELLLTVSYDGYLAAWVNPQERKTVLHGRVRVSRSELLCVSFEAMNELIVVGDNSGVVSTWRARDLEPRRAIPSRPPSPWHPTDTATLPSPMIAREGLSTPGSARPNSLYNKSNTSHTSNSKSSNKDNVDVRRIGHTEAVTTLLVDGHLVFSGGEDGRVFLWDLHMGLLMREYFLLHDVEIISQHKRTPIQRPGDGLFASSATVFDCSKIGHPRSTTLTEQRELYPYPPPEDVTSIVLLKERNGDFIVGTREGWLYHFQQRDSYPHYTFKHTSPVRTLCVIREGHEVSDELMGVGSPICDADPNATSGDNWDCDFEIGIGGEDGTIAVVRETYFASLM